MTNVQINHNATIVICNYSRGNSNVLIGEVLSKQSTAKEGVCTCKELTRDTLGTAYSCSSLYSFV